MAGFWKPGTSAPGVVERGDDSLQVMDGRLAHLPLTAQRKALPIFRHRNSVLFALEKHRTVVIVGETGCGKTTQVCSWIEECICAIQQFVCGGLTYFISVQSPTR